MKWPLRALALATAAVAVAVSGAAAASPSVVHSFSGLDGVSPTGRLVQGPDGSLYGATFYGGIVDRNPDGYGTIYRVDPAGNFTTVHRFNRTDGERPTGLVRGPDGFLYGTTSHGGDLDPSSYSGGVGTLFRIDTAGNLTVLHRFLPVEGMWPSAPPTFGPDGALYGTSSSDSTYPYHGTIWRWTATTGLTVIHEFATFDAVEPLGPLTLASDGNLYGTTNQGGEFRCGTVFRVTPPSSYAIVHSFGFGDGCEPKAGVIQARDGNFYGTTETGSGWGTVFRMDAGGSVTTLHAFDAYGLTGQKPLAGLYEAADGFLYGTASQGGVGDIRRGVVFRLDLAGALSVVHTFTGPDGSTPWSGVTQRSDGALYGVTITGGAFNRGVVYRLDGDVSPSLTALTLSQSVVRGGTSAYGTVRLSSAAPAGGAVVGLASSDPRLASVPTSVTVPDGAATATFEIKTRRNRIGTVTIRAAYAGVTVSSPLTITR